MLFLINICSIKLITRLSSRFHLKVYCNLFKRESNSQIRISLSSQADPFDQTSESRSSRPILIVKHLSLDNQITLEHQVGVTFWNEAEEHNIIPDPIISDATINLPPLKNLSNWIKQVGDLSQFIKICDDMYGNLIFKIEDDSIQITSQFKNFGQIATEDEEHYQQSEVLIEVKQLKKVIKIEKLGQVEGTLNIKNREKLFFNFILKFDMDTNIMIQYDLCGHSDE